VARSGREVVARARSVLRGAGRRRRWRRRGGTSRFALLRGRRLCVEPRERELSRRVRRVSLDELGRRGERAARVAERVERAREPREREHVPRETTQRQTKVGAYVSHPISRQTGETRLRVTVVAVAVEFRIDARAPCSNDRRPNL